MSTNKKIDDKKTVVIIGGGNAGGQVVQALSASLDPQKYNLILINPLPYSIFLIASLRMVVSTADDVEKSAMLPYDKIFRNGNGTFVQDMVTAIHPDARELDLKSGQKMSYDALILATGNAWAGPLAFPDTEAGVTKFIADSRTAFEKARKIVLVGGGAVGIELAGEIKDVWPNKPVTLVHKDTALLNATYPDRFRANATAGLAARGVNLVLGDSVVDIPTNGLVPSGHVTTASGKDIPADYVLATWGGRPKTSFIGASLGAEALTSTGTVKVKPTLQLASYPNIFAVGDIIEWKEQKQAGKTGAHAAVVAKNVVSVLNGSPVTVSYKGSYEMIVITNGKAGGFAYFGVLWGLVFGPWFARFIKSKGLLLPMYCKAMGY